MCENSAENSQADCGNEILLSIITLPEVSNKKEEAEGNDGHQRTVEEEDGLDEDQENQQEKQQIQLYENDDYYTFTEPDKGFGWAIVVAAFCVQFFVLGSMNNFGILFTQLLEEFKSTKLETGMFISPSIDNLRSRFANIFIIIYGRPCIQTHSKNQSNGRSGVLTSMKKLLFL